MAEPTHNHEMPGEITLNIPSHEPYLDLVHRVSMVIPEALGVDEGDADFISNAVLEAVRNAMGHGHKFNPEIPVTVSYSRCEDQLCVKIIDRGTGFDPDSVEDPTATENLMKTCGRGIFLMRSFMDSVEFERTEDSTIVTLRKTISPTESGE